MPHVQIKIFEHLHPYDEPNHFEVIEQEVNTFLLGIPVGDVYDVQYGYLPIGAPGRGPSVASSRMTRCIGMVRYKV